MYKISVIIPIYNSEKFLERCLTSIFNQTLCDIEIICINDGSTDNSQKILENYSKLPNFKILNQQTSGPSISRNNGLNIANGEYIAFLDSDDFIDNDFYEKLYCKAKETSADIICGSIIRENNKRKSVLLEYNNDNLAFEIKEKFKLAGSPKYNFVWNKLYKKEFLEQNNIKFFENIVYEDMCFTADVLEKSNGLAVVSNTYYHYWKHPNSLIKGSSDKFRANKIFAFNYLITICKRNFIGINYKDIAILKKDYIVFGLKLLTQVNYEATKKYYLFGLIKILEVREKI